MDTSNLQAKREVLREKKRELWRLLAIVFASIVLIAITEAALLLLFRNAYFGGFLPAVPMYFVLNWFSMKLKPLKDEIRNINWQIEEETSAQQRDRIIARIQTGQIKPNPHLQ